MEIHLFHTNKIEGSSLYRTLRNEGYQIIYHSDNKLTHFGFSCNEHDLLLINSDFLLRLSNGEIKKLQQSNHAIILMGLLSEIHWFIELKGMPSRGFVCIKDGIEELFECMRKLSTQQTSISPGVSDFFKKPTIIQQQLFFHKSLDQHITKTELKVMQEIATGKTTKQIANNWSRSPHTINNHRKNISKKLELSGTFQLNKFCLDKQNEIQTLISLTPKNLVENILEND